MKNPINYKVLFAVGVMMITLLQCKDAEDRASFAINECVIFNGQEYEVFNSETVTLPSTGVKKTIYILESTSDSTRIKVSAKSLTSCK